MTIIVKEMSVESDKITNKKMSVMIVNNEKIKEKRQIILKKIVTDNSDDVEWLFIEEKSDFKSIFDCFSVSL